MESMYFGILIKNLKNAKKSNDVPVSSLIVDQNNIVKTIACNNRVKKKNISGHAEILAINKLMKKAKTINLSEYTIYSLLEPCPMCYEAIKQSKIRQINFYLKNEKFGILNSGILVPKEIILKEIGTTLQKETYGKILKDFFIKQR